jgi:hypothetical protein
MDEKPNDAGQPEQSVIRSEISKYGIDAKFTVGIKTEDDDSVLTGHGKRTTI